MSYKLWVMSWWVWAWVCVYKHKQVHLFSLFTPQART